MVPYLRKERALEAIVSNRLAVLFWPLHSGPSFASEGYDMNKIRTALLSYSGSVKDSYCRSFVVLVRFFARPRES
jgi:hypothetical protein